MNVGKQLLRLARNINDPRDVILMLAMASVGIIVLYLLPDDILEDEI
jgi:hypothetical protein